MGDLNLADLISLLVEEEGISHEEAARVAAATLRAKRGGTLARSNAREQFPSSPQQDGRGVDYGEETPAQAKERWMRQEMEDPNGLFAGGSTAGGVFGDGAISSESFDPGAVARTVNLRAQLGQMQAQVEMLQLMREMRQEMGAASHHRQQLPGRENARTFPDVQPGRRHRVLSAKKRDR